MKLKRMISKVQRGYISLRMRFVAVFIIAAISSVVLYVASNVGAHYYIKNVYLSEENKTAREAAYHEDLQQYIRDNGITFESIDRVSEWAKENQYVYLMIYKEQTDDEALFIPDDMVDKFPSGAPLNPGGSGVPDIGSGEGADDIEPDAGDEEVTDPDLGDENEGDEGENGDTGTDDTPAEGEDDPDSTDPDEGEPDEGDEDNTEDNTPEDDTPATPDQPDKPEHDEPLGGITINWPTRSELEAEAKSRDMLFIELPENQYVYAKFAEYTEYLYYDIANISCIVLAALALLIIFLLYISRLTKRISRLGQEVTIVASGETDMHITVSGEDEISELATNVESMRSTIVENYKKEKEALDSNTALITSMSHDIRTPLTVLFGYIDVMKARAGDDEVMQGYISAAESTAQRLKHLSDDMFGYFLVFGKDETTLSVEEYDAVTLLEQMLTEHIFLMKEQGYDVELSLESERLANRLIKTDASSMVRILGNIFSNLVKYADQKKPVNISIYLSGEYVVAEFFNAVRTDTEQVESNRIGLKTCQKLAEKMGAKFESFALQNDFYVKLSLPIV